MNSQYHPTPEAKGKVQEHHVIGSEIAMPSRAEGMGDDTDLKTLINQIEFIRTLAAAKDTIDFGQRILAIIHRLGFSDYAVMRITANDTLEIPFCSLSHDWQDTYRTERFHHHDMTLDYIKTGNLEPIYLSTIGRIIQHTIMPTQTLKKNQEILDLYKHFDINDAYLVPAKTNKDNEEHKILFSVMAKGVTPDNFLLMIENSQPILHLLINAINFIDDAKFPPQTPKHGLTPKPLRLITTMAKQDLSLSQAAQQLCISIDTANKHMAVVKKSLGTSSQANAVYLAIKQGLIDID